MIERLLPPEVYSRELRGDDPGASLFAEEEALVGGSTEARRREFATARTCARQALKALGLPEAPILRGAKREPCWPEGIVGSITHCRGYRAAAVARGAVFLTLGIDAEIDEALPAGVERYVLRDEERIWLSRAPGGVHWGRVMFSAKESVYKAWFPLTGRWLGFDDAIVRIDPRSGTFTAELLADPGIPGLNRFSGRFLVEDGLVATAIAVPR